MVGKCMRQEADFAGRQIRGARKAQEDHYSFCLLSGQTDGLEGVLLAMADGMGGYAGGSLASRLVVEAFIENFCHAQGTIPARLLSSLRASEHRLREEIARREETLSQMGSTLVGVVWTPGQLHWVSVGDSGLFLYRRDTLRRLNADHSMAPVLQEAAARGEITPEEAATHPDRNVLRSAIAVEPLEMYELRDLPFKLDPGDIILAATDGINSVRAEVLIQILAVNASKPAECIAASLLRAVKEARNLRQDNATVAVLRNPDQSLDRV
jgi:serine/threonine protein phosphatase PrpC